MNSLKINLKWYKMCNFDDALWLISKHTFELCGLFIILLTLYAKWNLQRVLNWNLGSQCEMCNIVHRGVWRVF